MHEFPFRPTLQKPREVDFCIGPHVGQGVECRLRIRPIQGFIANRKAYHAVANSNIPNMVAPTFMFSMLLLMRAPSTAALDATPEPSSKSTSMGQPALNREPNTLQRYQKDEYCH